MISPKIRSFAKLIALLGNERKMEKTYSRLPFPEKINKPRNTVCLGSHLQWSGEEGFCTVQAEMCSPCSPLWPRMAIPSLILSASGNSILKLTCPLKMVLSLLQPTVLLRSAGPCSMVLSSWFTIQPVLFLL